MEFDFSVNALLEEGITRLDNRVLPRGSNRNHDRIRENRRLLFQVIDRMGEASAKAQGLYGAITGGRKLEMSDHILYIMKDPGACNGKGAIVGLLKIGHKKLFVYDNHGVQHEMNPMCILDFYVHESRQRQGCGKRMFEFMLRENAYKSPKEDVYSIDLKPLQWENIHPNHFAIDRPSHKFSMFLAKHYNLKAVIHQVNNFVVFEGFFTSRTDVDHSKPRNGRAPVYRRPDDYRKTPQYNRGYTVNSRPPSGRLTGRPPSGKTSHRYTNGQPVNPAVTEQNKENAYKSPKEDVYSIDLKPLQSPEINKLNLNPRPTSGMRQNQAADDRNQDPVHLDMRSLSAGSNSSRGLGAGINMYSRHNITPPSADNRPPRHHSSLERLQGNTDPGPPMLQRAGPPPGYMELMNLHQDYQGRQGHLRLQSESTHSLPQVHAPPTNQSMYSQAPNRNYAPPLYQPPSARSASSTPAYKDTSWTVHGIVPDHRIIASRHNTHSRLW